MYTGNRVMGLRVGVGWRGTGPGTGPCVHVGSHERKIVHTACLRDLPFHHRTLSEYLVWTRSCQYADKGDQTLPLRTSQSGGRG